MLIALCTPCIFLFWKQAWHILADWHIQRQNNMSCYKYKANIRVSRGEYLTISKILSFSHLFETVGNISFQNEVNRLTDRRLKKTKNECFRWLQVVSEYKETLITIKDHYDSTKHFYSICEEHLKCTYLGNVGVVPIKSDQIGAAAVPSMEEVKFKLAQILHSLQLEPGKVSDKTMTSCSVWFYDSSTVLQ